MKIKKYVLKFAASILVVTSFLSIPVHAEEQKLTFKIEDAIKSAISYNVQMSINTKDNEALRNQLYMNDTTTYYDYQSIYLQKAQNEQQRKMLEDKIASDVTSRYNNILVLNKEIGKLSKDIEVSAKELKQMEVKNKNGLVNPVEYQKQEVALAASKTMKASKEEELKNAAAYFKLITGKDINRYVLDNTIKYEPFRITTSVEGYIDSKLDIYFKYDKELAELNAENFPVTQDYVTYVKGNNQAETSVLKFEDRQKQLKQRLMETYSNLVSLEEQINTLQPKLVVYDKELKSNEIRYKAGLISIIDYDKKMNEKQDVEIQILKLMMNYNTLKDKIQKPWVEL